MLIDEPVQLGRWRRFAEPAVVLWIAAATGAGWWGRVDLDLGRGTAQQHAADRVVALLVALPLVGAAGVIAVDVLAGVVRQVWLGRAVPWPLSRLLRRSRLHRWQTADTGVQAATDGDRRRRLAGRRARIALAEPRSPTWTGDRMTALESRVRNTYGLDLPSAWPRLWLVLPDAVRAELRHAAGLWHAAARWIAWAVLYAVLALTWWPLAILSALTLIAAVRAGRGATALITDLMEAAVDLHGPALAAQLGCADGAGPDLTPDTGTRINRVTRKAV
ncbi:hypothetical protein Daura_28140 [Dactylosporangium aurantiacum]|uniref:Uncharacterized protein n=1 Tax=Dactylosporangium aurantiacum TaxID=35754 RepID=A0A9Q9IC23_9ACTN|nr:hypothetical protein [Dactylosporangium aurantiacum]MDG6106951.1 hypothetical protein [Dactylosporangium aurantiacum]UWZ50689.1 hypothetical protein Daura_28140 [Dactylosporangium aurantiacum]